MKKCLLMESQIMQMNLMIVLRLDGIHRWVTELEVPM